MRKITAISMVSMDGVMQAPGGRKEDSSNGFKYGGWTEPFYHSESDSKAMEKFLKQRADYLLGRKTFDIWEGYWPKHGDFWPAINQGTKYVLSRTRKKSPWAKSIFIQNVGDIKKLKKSKGADIQVWGSSKLIQLLLKHDLVDELRLIIYPLVLGQGKKLFADGILPTTFTLTESNITKSGVVSAHYRRSGKVKTGTIGV